MRIALEGTGVCASNLGPWEGLPWIPYPMKPGEGGHEPFGRVVDCGPGVDERWLGKRVAALSYRAFAEYDVAKTDTLVELPAALDGKSFPGEAFACAMNIARRAGVRAGERVAIVGVGFLGAILTRLCKKAGAHVVGISRRPFALELARRMGADETIPMDDHHRILEEARDRTGGEMYDRVFECAGKQWPLDLGAELTKTRGTLIVAGYHQDGPRQVNMQLWNWRGIDVISAHERDPAVYVRGMREAVRAITDGVLDAEALVTHRLPLARLSEALDAASARPDGFLKAVVTTGGDA